MNVEGTRCFDSMLLGVAVNTGALFSSFNMAKCVTGNGKLTSDAPADSVLRTADSSQSCCQSVGEQLFAADSLYSRRRWAGWGDISVDQALLVYLLFRQWQRSACEGLCSGYLNSDITMHG